MFLSGTRPRDTIDFYKNTEIHTHTHTQKHNYIAAEYHTVAPAEEEKRIYLVTP